MKFSRRLTTTSTPDLIPMIDIVFQLVVFFLMSSTFVVSPGISLDLPGSSTTENVVVEGIMIYAYQDGRLYLGDETTTFNDLRVYLGSQSSPTSIPVTLFAEGGVAYQRIIDILDLLRQEGFSRVALRAEVQEE
ncbi:MAG: biopolymer transporter ExbD [Spirochaetales bacterium]|nr:biopolymer transporter ExbD [Spirochaetales bacterium]